MSTLAAIENMSRVSAVRRWGVEPGRRWCEPSMGGPDRSFWDDDVMRNTSKSQSLLRAQVDREWRRLFAAGGAANPGGASAPFEVGERILDAAMRSACAELSKHARAVEELNEASHPRGLNGALLSNGDEWAPGHSAGDSQSSGNRSTPASSPVHAPLM